MIQSLQKYILDNQLFTRGDKLLVAVSGGVDSMVLVSLLKSLNYRLSIAHCNFQLRGIESDEDEHFVRNFAAFNNINCYVKLFKTDAYAHDNKISIQEAARELRYDWFDILLKTKDYDKIVVAHHANDSIETALMNFAKGAGLRGLKGIQNKYGAIVRPLLWATKDQIMQYAIENNIFYREDSSNFKDDYTRNFIRHNLIPNFQHINPDFEQTAIQNLNYLNQTFELFSFFIQNIKKEVLKKVDNQYFISIEKLIQYPSVETVLYEILRDFNFNKTQVANILEAEQTAHRVGTKFYSDSHCLLIDRAHFILKINENAASTEGVEYLIDEDTTNFNLPDGHLELDYLTSRPFEILKNKKIAQFDYDKLSFPLKLRHWRQGDRFCPFGMQGQSQLLSDFFRAHKVSDFDKDKIWVLETADGDIAWLVGWRTSENYKITEGSRCCLKLTFHNN